MSRVDSGYAPVKRDKTKQMSRNTFRHLQSLCRISSLELSTSELQDKKEELKNVCENEVINIDQPRLKGSIPLCDACRAGNVWAVEILLNYGANVNVIDKYKCSPTYIAASHGYKEILQLLLERNADINVKNLQGYFPLLSAVENNHKEVAQLLIQAGADVNIYRPNTFGVSMSLLTFVLFAKSDIPFAHELLEAGVCPHTFDPPLNFILLEYRGECCDFIKKLVYAGFDFYCEGWIKMVNSKLRANLAEVSESDLDMIEFLEYENRNAPSLERLCRTAIRSALTVSRVKSHLKNKVDQLPIPNEVKKYLLLHYV